MMPSLWRSAKLAICGHSAIILLCIGMMIRLPAVGTPLVEGQRNAQTAVLTAGMVEDGELRLDSVAPWRGDLNARLVMEFPVYNLTVLAITALPGIPLDAAGRLTSLVFWVLSFVALQALWLRTLPPQARFWANLLFVLAPMNWYLSTAFMPETLVQLLGILFMVLVLDYSRQGKRAVLVGLVAVAGLGLLIKLPSFAHLGIFAAFVLVDRCGFKALFRPGLLVGGTVIVAALALWGKYAEGANAAYFSTWAGWEGFRGFVKPEVSRLEISYYIPLVGYNLAFIVPVVAAPFALGGLVMTIHRFRSQFTSRLWVYLLASLALYCLVWGKGAPAQNYYNLPNLVFFCAMFGIGISACAGWMAARPASPPLGTALAWILVLGLVISGAAGYAWLARPDRVTVEVANWVKANTSPDDLIIYQPRHQASVMDYEHQPLLSHLIGRRTWIWTRSTPRFEKERALATAPFAIITHPQSSTGAMEALRRRFKGTPPQPPSPLQDEHPRIFHKVHTNDLFTVLARHQ